MYIFFLEITAGLIIYNVRSSKLQLVFKAVFIQTTTNNF